MTFSRDRRVVAAIVAASCMVVPASASAASPLSTYQSDAAQSGSAGSLPSTDRSDAAQSGSDGAGTPYSPAGFKGGDSAQNQPTATTTFPPAEFRGGDTPIDHPGADRARSAAPTTIEVVHPERTIVRDVDEALPLILSSAALVLVLAGFGVMLIRTRMAPRPGHGH